MRPPALKTVHFYDTSLGIGALQALYLDRETNWLRPNLSFVHEDPQWCFEINEIGLKGDAVDASRRLALVWGDSVVFGVGPGWAWLLDDFIPGYQFLNGGIEGDSYDRILARAVKLSQMRDVELNLVFLGWHTIGYNKEVKERLEAALPQLRNPVLLTIPSALNERIIDQDLSSAFVNAEDGMALGFYYQESEPYSIEWQNKILQHITERNTIIRETARENGVPLVDLFESLNSSNCADFREYFFDVYHPRPSAYPIIARAVSEAIRNLDCLKS